MTTPEERLVGEADDPREELIRRAAALTVVLAAEEAVEKDYRLRGETDCRIAECGEDLRVHDPINPKGHSIPGRPDNNPYVQEEWDRWHDSRWRRRDRIEMVAARLAEVRSITWDVGHSEKFLNLNRKQEPVGVAYLALERAIDDLTIEIGRVLMQEGEFVYLGERPEPSSPPVEYAGPKAVVE